MAQILDPLPPDPKGKFLCCYVNATSKIQVARISNISNWYFERVVFPGQRLVFEAPESAQLEIHTGMMASAILSDTIPCDRLAFDEANSSDLQVNLDNPNSDSIDKNSFVSSISSKIGDTTKPLTIVGFTSI
ncbi:DUF1830 domain-containing protein [Rivularia sp. UHCC 0363]|uniref:DUF1830 domain-containing protein n=1 Tax=Rivularia sp. UHCC 0363 TaxID=3110244 RepID=UPI002B210F19|nr:DUF1830 domain-containing protein [Rivularia sp. UHCC 0363]MEA5593912.1 DUF1830 domain-containing protein [Rivularia sp. UHCC 0363]